MYFFIHIEKTAGSSFVEGFVKPNFPDNARVGSVRSVFKNRRSDFLHGHCPHGLHFVADHDVKYLTFLREPVDRAVSYYYFIKDLERVDLFPRHPIRDYADSVTIVEFFQNPKFSNFQTRFLAGQVYHRAYPWLHKSRRFQERMLASAKRNLDSCIAFGIKEEYEESVEVMKAALRSPEYVDVRCYSKTRKRPSIDEINSLNPRIVPELEELNSLDRRLYEYACDRFTT